MSSRQSGNRGLSDRLQHGCVVFAQEAGLGVISAPMERKQPFDGCRALVRHGLKQQICEVPDFIGWDLDHACPTIPRLGVPASKKIH
jgi:hypothetical protein